MADRDGLLNRCTGKTVPGVRIPLSPPFRQKVTASQVMPWGRSAPQLMAEVVVDRVVVYAVTSLPPHDWISPINLARGPIFTLGE